MGWFDRQAAGRPAAEVAREHGRYVRAAGVDRALDALSGPFGLRRYVVRFERRGQKVRVVSVEAQPLGTGGGPPPEDPSGQRLAALEKALTALQRNMATGPAWERGVVSYLRDARGRATLAPFFDEDSDQLSLDSLPIPGPGSHPLETPEYLDLMGLWAPRMAEVQARTTGVSADWDLWEIKDDRLLELQFDVDDQDRPGEVRRLRCRTLATFDPRWGRFKWQVPGPLFDEKVFASGEIHCDFAAASELCLLTCARLRASWLFVSACDDAGRLLMVAVFD